MLRLYACCSLFSYYWFGVVNKNVCLLMLIGSAFLTACRRWRHVQVHKVKNTKKKTTALSSNQKKNNKPTFRSYYAIQVDGIECRQCVLSALKALSRVDGIVDVSCHGSHKDYEHVWFTCTLAAGGTVLPVTIMQHRIAEQDLTLTTIEGTFYGVVLGANAGELQFSIAGLNAPVKLLGVDDILQKIYADSQKTPHRQMRLAGALNVMTNSLVINAVCLP